MDRVVSSFLRQHRDEVLRSWETAVVSEERAVALLGLALRDDVPALLDALADWLEGGESPERSRVTAEASKHVMQRLDHGMSLAQVFREYRILRETIIAAVLQAEADEQERTGASGDAGRIARIKGLADILTLHGHRVQVARDGRTGIALARELQPDVILCDIGLPDVDGYDVARALRRDGPLRNTKLVALSGYAQPEDQQRARDAGFDAHVAKPPDLEQLLVAVAKDRS